MKISEAILNSLREGGFCVDEASWKRQPPKLAEKILIKAKFKKDKDYIINKDDLYATSVKIGDKMSDIESDKFMIDVDVEPTSIDDVDFWKIIISA